jgi:hypothetical protein
MAKIKFVEGSEPLNNEHDGFTFQRNNYGHSMFPASRSARKRYGHQWKRQHANQKAVLFWRDMPQATKDLWALFASTYPQPSPKNPDYFLNGFELFVRRNSYCFLNHGIPSDFMTEPEINLLSEGVITAEIAWSKGAIDCTELYIDKFGILPVVGDFVICRLIPYAEYSGQFFDYIEMTLEVKEIYLDGLFVTVTVPDEMEQVTVSVYLSKVFHQSVQYAGTKPRYMGCFTKKKFTDLIDVPDITANDAGKYWGVDESGEWALIDFSQETIINVVNNYTELTEVTNNYTVFDINTQMFYTYIDETWYNLTLNVNLVRIVEDYTILTNVVNNSVVFDITTQNFYFYHESVWIEIGGGGGGLTCEDLLDCPVIISILERLEQISIIISELHDTPVPSVHLGCLYNIAAVQSPLNISSSDDWFVPDRTMRDALVSYVGGNTDGGGPLKSTDSNDWDAPNSGATNSTGYTGVGAGYIDQSGVYTDYKKESRIWMPQSGASFLAHGLQLYYDSPDVGNLYSRINEGASLRLARSASGSSDGTKGTYVGNDGKAYPTVVIDGVEFMQYNLAETKYRDGSDIPLITSAGDWGSSSEPQMAYPNYDSDLV